MDHTAHHICDATQKFDALSTDAPMFILGDFNLRKLDDLSANLPPVHYVHNPNEQNNLLVLRVPNAHRSIPKPSVHLVPIYKCVLKRAKCAERQVKEWNEDSVARLQGCSDCTKWDVFFRDSCDSLDELTDVVTSYVCFFVDTYTCEEA